MLATGAVLGIPSSCGSPPPSPCLPACLPDCLPPSPCLPACLQVRRVLDVMRGRSFEDAIQMLEYMPYRACEHILKTLKSVSTVALGGDV